MQIAVKDIGPSGHREIAEVPIADMPLLMELVRSEGIGFPVPVMVDIHLVRQEDSVVVTGTLDTCAALNCSRCLEETTASVHADIRIVFEPATADADALGEVVELTEADMERVPYDGDFLDLAAVIQEEVLAAMPLRPLCQTACKGLCPGCGANLNESACSCSNTPVDPRLAVLKNWRSDTES